MSLSDNLTEIIVGTVTVVGTAVGAWITARFKTKKELQMAGEARESDLLDRVKAWNDDVYTKFIGREAKIQELITQVALLHQELADMKVGMSTMKIENDKLRRVVVHLRKENQKLQARLDKVNHGPVPSNGNG